MWFSALTVFKLPEHFKISAEALAAQLQDTALPERLEVREADYGWVPPVKDSTQLAWGAHEQLLVTLRHRKRLLPAAVVAEAVAERVAEIEAREAVKVRGKRLKELKADVRDELAKRAFVVGSPTQAWIDCKHGWLVIDSVSSAKTEDMLAMLGRCVEEFDARAWRVATDPVAAMTEWLSTGEAPSGFTVDQDAELRSKDGRASIRYANQSVDAEDIARHTKAGRQCTRLALTWSDRVSFVLTEQMQLKRVRPLDVLREKSSAKGADAEEAFASDMALMTGELAALLADLTEALGGLAANGRLSDAAGAQPSRQDRAPVALAA